VPLGISAIGHSQRATGTQIYWEAMHSTGFQPVMRRYAPKCDYVNLSY
jgi:hypothetical protein